MKGKKIVAASTIAASLMFLMILSSFAPLTTSLTSEKLGSISNNGVAPLSSDMTFTSGQTMYFHSTEEMEIASPNSMLVWSGVAMKFTSTIKIQILDPSPDGYIDPCDYLDILWSDPAPYIPPVCSWWEVVDQFGNPLGEFHVDWSDGGQLHVDSVYPSSIPITPGQPYIAIQKIDIIEPCRHFEVHWPSGWWPEPCTWWEIMDPETGKWTGYEFHVDWTNESCEFHIDEIIPGPYILPFPWYEIQARMKIPSISPCDYFVVEEPEDWWPEPCTWWEILDPFTGEDTGVEFHVDWTNESCEFHIDEVFDPTGFSEYYFDFPVPYFEARQKITSIQSCDWFIIIDPIFDPEPCTWWEILDPVDGGPTGYEFHIDDFDGIDMFHVDEVDPDPLDIPWLSPTLTVRKKIDSVTPCDWFKVDDPQSYMEPCSWWKILDPVIGDVEFHIDDVSGSWFHVDEVIGAATFAPIHEVYAERKIDDLEECDWFLVISGTNPTVCSWWEIISPEIWTGHIFHVDSVAGDWFHIDIVDGGGPPPPPPPPPPWNVTAIPYEQPSEWYMKAPYPDYAPVGMPDFDQRQWNSYNWSTWGVWTHCGPTAVANSIWWLDSEFEPNTIPPPTIIDNYPLVQAYGGWDDHDPLNAPWLIEHLAYLMDTDGQRTFIAHMGTDVLDMQAGITHYLSWSGVNPLGDVDGDGNVTLADYDIVNAAMGTVPGVVGWDLRADIYPVTQFGPYTADNVIDAMDLMLVMSYMDATGQFYEHTEFMPEWELIQAEVEKCQDVVLLLVPYYFDGFEYYPYDEGAHYVTVAGLNGSHAGTPADPWEIVFSDPIRDNAEAGGPGNVPIAHVHMPPEPPYITHNNASLVSHDMYHVIWEPCPGGPLTIIDYMGGAILPPGPYPEWRIQIEAAVITSPYLAEEHDVAVINVTTSKTGCLPKETVGQGMNVSIFVTVENQGSVSETFNVNAFADAASVGSQAVALNSGQNITLEFIWDTTGYVYGNYTISATADTVSGETDTADNTMINGIVLITIPGDVDGDRDVDIFDIVRITTIYKVSKPDPRWDPNADLVEDGKIDIFDVVAAAGNYKMSW